MYKKALLAAGLVGLLSLTNCKKSNNDVPQPVKPVVTDNTPTVTITPLAATIFKANTGGYLTYRTPALLTTQKGTLLAFCEGRATTTGNSGDMDIIYKRSTDGGATWSDQKVVFNDGTNTCSSPVLVQDKITGVIFLFMSRNVGTDSEANIVKKTSTTGRTVWISSSADDGVSWTTPKDITSSVKSSDWQWYATGPGTGIQLTHGPHAGRLVIACYHSYYVGKVAYYSSHTIYSDNDGTSWSIGASTAKNASDCQIAEIADGNGGMVLNAHYLGGKKYRALSYSYNGGTNWVNLTPISALPDPNSEASMVRYSWAGSGKKSCILLSNNDDPASLVNLTLKASFDEGATWNTIKTIHAGPSAYSSLTVMADTGIGCLYEGGTASYTEGIIFERFASTETNDLLK